MAKINHNLNLCLKCEEWKSVKELFKCESVDKYSVDGSDSMSDEDYSGNGSAQEDSGEHKSTEKPSQESEESDSGGDEDRPEGDESNDEEEEVTTRKPKRKTTKKTPTKKKKKIIKKKTKSKPTDILPTPRSLE